MSSNRRYVLRFVGNRADKRGRTAEVEVFGQGVGACHAMAVSTEKHKRRGWQPVFELGEYLADAQQPVSVLDEPMAEPGQRVYKVRFLNAAGEARYILQPERDGFEGEDELRAKFALMQGKGWTAAGFEVSGQVEPEPSITIGANGMHETELRPTVEQHNQQVRETGKGQYRDADSGQFVSAAGL